MTIRADSGIYRITIDRGSEGPAYYIGHSAHLRRRWIQHRYHLRNGRHTSPILQRAFDKYGEASFAFQVEMNCCADRETLVGYEQQILDREIAHSGAGYIYNALKLCVTSRLGVITPAETRRKISAATKGRKMSAENIELHRILNLGRKLSEETIAKRTAKQKGRVTKPETRAKQSAAALGRKHTQETKAKISASKAGQGPSQEHMEMLRLLNTGKKVRPEIIARRVATRRANAGQVI